MTILLLLQSLLLSVSSWYTAPEPPDSAQFVEFLGENPLEVLVFMARSGWIPDFADPETPPVSMLELYHKDADVIAWGTQLMEVPFLTDMTPLLIEFGDELIMPDQESILDNPQLLDSYLRRIQHMIASHGEPDEPERFVEVIIGCWEDLPDDSKSLCLEVLGKLGIDITGDISIDELENSDLRAAARYFSELDREHSFSHDTAETTLERVYIASCNSPDGAALMLSDTSWAVRYNAVLSCDPALLEPVLYDSVPYVALAAAIARNNAQYSDGAAVIRKLAVMEGPVGHLAAAELSIRDTLLLRELMIHPEPGRRAAAQSAWISESTGSESLIQADCAAALLPGSG